MTIELDHVFICVAKGGPEAARLVQFGLAEGAPNTHPGQGTANRRFFFRNGMLELLWVEDSADAQSEQSAPTRLWERWSSRSNGVCPFGIVMRPAEHANSDPPFPALEYRPRWLSPDLKIHISPAGLDEPMWVYMPVLQEFNHQQHFVEHPNGVREITKLSLATPGFLQSAAALACVKNGVLAHETGSAQLLVMEFDHGSRHQSTDFRPELPLVVRH